MFSLTKYKSFSSLTCGLTEIKAFNPVSVAHLMIRSSKPSLLFHACYEPIRSILQVTERNERYLTVALLGFFNQTI